MCTTTKPSQPSPRVTVGGVIDLNTSEAKSNNNKKKKKKEKKEKSYLDELFDNTKGGSSDILNTKGGSSDILEVGGYGSDGGGKMPAKQYGPDGGGKMQKKKYLLQLCNC